MGPRDFSSGGRLRYRESSSSRKPIRDARDAIPTESPRSGPRRAEAIGKGRNQVQLERGKAKRQLCFGETEAKRKRQRMVDDQAQGRRRKFLVEHRRARWL